MLDPDGEIRDRLCWNWSVQDFMTIYHEYGVTPKEELARKLGRSGRAVQEFARRHGVSAIENRRRAGKYPKRMRRFTAERQAA